MLSASGSMAPTGPLYGLNSPTTVLARRDAMIADGWGKPRDDEAALQLDPNLFESLGPGTVFAQGETPAIFRTLPQKTRS